MGRVVRLIAPLMLVATPMLAQSAPPQGAALDSASFVVMKGQDTVAVERFQRFDVTWWGKAGTFALMVAFPMFLFGASDIRLAGLWQFVGWGFGIPGLILSYYAAITYIPTIRRALGAGRAARARGPA